MADQHFYRIERGGNIAAVVFVHGIFGDFRETWADFPFLIAQDTSLNHCDVICWGYPSNLISSLRPRLPFHGRRIPDLATVADALASDLANPEIGGTYSDLALVGHSMGGLVIKKMVIANLAKPEPDIQLLERIQHVVLYATPSEGVQLPKIFKVHPQARSITCDSALVDELRREWIKRVYRVDPARCGAGMRHIPVTAIVGTEDNAVPVESVRSYYDDVETAPGTHTEVCKPATREHTSFQVLKRVVLSCTIPSLIVGKDAVVKANLQIVQRARDILFAVGSRSRDAEYLQAIEEKLRASASLIHYRLLFGPPRHQVFKKHVANLLDIRSPDDRSEGFKTIHIAIYDEAATQPEVFLCGNERMCLAVLPSMTGLGEYSTAAVFTHPDHVHAYTQFTKQLYHAGRKLEQRQLIDELRVQEAAAAKEITAAGGPNEGR